jgi:proton glutamate symport protein
MRAKRVPLWIRILFGMIVGVIFGMLAVMAGLEKFTHDWVKPWGIIFLNLLKLIAVPLIFTSLIKGITSLTDIAKLSRVGLKTVGLYVFTMVIAIIIGLTFVNIIQPGNVFPQDKKLEYSEKYGNTVMEKGVLAKDREDQSPLQFLVDIVPENIIAAASENSNMLQIIFFAVLLSIAIILLPREKTEIAQKFFENIYEIILKIIDLIMDVAPYGVFALMAALVVDFAGDLDVFKALGLYMLTVIGGLLLMLIFVQPLLVKVFSGIPIKKFLKGMLPIQLVAFTTSSSAATLPVTMKHSEEAFGLPKSIGNFVLPVGVTLNMDGTSLYQAIAAVFIAQVFGIDLTLGQMLLILLTALISSMGTPGIPGGSIIMLIIVLNSVGVPIEGLALIMGVDRPLDMLRTVVNVTGDVTVATMVAKSEKNLDLPD